MNLRRIFIALSLLAICAVYVSPGPRASAQPEYPVLVLVSSASRNTDIGMGTLRRVFEGYSTEVNGDRLVPFNLMLGAPARTVFDRAVLGLAPNQVGPFWVDRKIRQSVDPPRTIPSPQLMLRVVASLRGGIGYLSADPRTLPGELRALSIDGRGPTDPRYPLTAD